MKKFIWIVLFFYSANNLICQEVIETDIKEFRSKNANIIDIIGIDEKYFYTQEWYLSGIYYSVFELETGEMLSAQKESDLITEETEVYANEGFYTNTKGLHIIKSYYDKDEEINKIKIVKREVTVKDISLLDFEIKVPKSYKNSISTRIVTSKDKKNILCLVTWLDKNTETLYVSLNLFDSAFNRVFQKEIKYDNTIELSNVTLDNEGSIYYRRINAKGDNHIVAFDANRDFDYWETFIDRSFIKEKEEILNVNLTVNNSNDLIVTGLYVNEKEVVEKLFYQKYDGFSKELIKSDVLNFSDSFIEKYILREKSFFKLQPQNKYFSGLNYFLTDSNELIIVGEDKYTIQRQPGRTEIYEYTTNYNDIILLTINNEGILTFSGGIERHFSMVAYRPPDSYPEGTYKSEAYYGKIVDNKLMLIYIDKEPLQIKQFNPLDMSITNKELGNFTHDWPLSIKNIETSDFSNKTVVLRKDPDLKKFKYCIYSL